MSSISISRRKLADYAAREIAAGRSVKNTLRGVAAHLIESKRTREAELIVRDIEAALARQNIVVVDTEAARPLTAEAKELIEQAAKREYNATQVVIRESIDPSVLAGIRVKLPDRMLDSTVAHKLDTLTTHTA